MRYDPRRAQPEDAEALRARDEFLRLQAENAKPGPMVQPTKTPVGVPAYGRMQATRMPVPRAPSTGKSGRLRIVFTIAAIIFAFVLGFSYANALTGGLAVRQLQMTEGLLPSP